jgi:multiple sugar transport system substrate-binding protein
MLHKVTWTAILALVLVGCVPVSPAAEGSRSAQSSAAPTVVTLLVSGGPAEQAAYAAVVEGFHAVQDEVRVEMSAVPGTNDFLTRLTTDFAAGTPPDVFLLNYRRMAQFYNRGAIEPLGPMLATSALLSEEDFFPVALDAFRDGQGVLVCMPQNVSSQVVYYNRDLFDRAGVAYPQPGWTWEDFRQTALALTLPDADGDGYADQYGLGLEPALIRMVPFIWDPTRLTLDDPATRAALQFVVDLALVDGVTPKADAVAVASIPDRFLAGNIAMYIDSRVFTPTMRETVEFAWDVAMLPRGVQPANVLHSDGYCMASASQVKEAAWRFVEYAMGAEGQRIAAELGRTVPSRYDVAGSEAFLDADEPPANAQAWLDNMEANMGVLPKIENWNAIERTAAAEFELAFLGDIPLDEAIDHVQTFAAEGFVPIR